MSYWALLKLVLPVFALIASGVVLRRFGQLTEEADSSLLRVIVTFLYPCLILDNVLGNPALRSPGNLLVPPLIGFLVLAAAIEFSYQAGKLIGLQLGAGLRTFAFGTGTPNYGYIPIPVVAALFGRRTLGVLLVHNVGCDCAVWTVGILMLSGLTLREGWRRMINGPTVALVAGVGLNLVGAAPHIPSFVLATIHLAADAAIPLGLILIGATFENLLLKDPRGLFDRKVTPAACLLRLGCYPIAVLLLAKCLPLTPDLKRVLVVQAAMPAGVMPVIIAKHFGGRPETAIQVMAGTNVAALLLLPLWLKFGMAWVGV